MTQSSFEQSTVVRTSRGLSIAGTRITLYALLDYLHADWPASLIQDWFNLTDQQIGDVLAYLEDHREEVEYEYAQVLEQAEQNRQYWDSILQTRQNSQTALPVSPEQAALRAKLQEWKAQLQHL